MNITFGGTFDPYALDSDGKRIDKSLFAERRKAVPHNPGVYQYRVLA